MRIFNIDYKDVDQIIISTEFYDEYYYKITDPEEIKEFVEGLNQVHYYFSYSTILQFTGRCFMSTNIWIVSGNQYYRYGFNDHKILIDDINFYCKSDFLENLYSSL